MDREQLIESATTATGSTFVRTLYNTELMRLGGAKLTKPALAGRGIVNFSAAKRLGEYLAKHKIKTAKQLYQLSPYDLVRVRLHGPALLWTAMLLLESEGYNPMAWWGELPTISTVKTRAFRPKRRPRRNGDVE